MVASDDGAEQLQGRTMRLLGVPSSTTCRETIALASNAQKRATTRPEWMAVSATSGVEPCSRNEPVVMS